jgi:hypothetical protein
MESFKFMVEVVVFGETASEALEHLKGEFDFTFGQDNNLQAVVYLDSGTEVDDFVLDADDREKMVALLTDDDIDTISQGISAGDMSYLNDILCGNGWTQYNNMTDIQINTEYNERFGG